MVRFLVTMVVLVCSGTGFAGDAQGNGEPDDKNLSLYPRVKMETTVGDIVLELNGELAPITTMNFIWYAEDGFYNGTIFHRVMKELLIQGGGYLHDLEKKTEGLRPGIPNEWNSGLKNEQWSISMSRLGSRPNSATSQFFINLVDNLTADQPRPDGAAHAVFGKVVHGFKTVARIRDVKTTTNDKYGGSAPTIPAEPVIIKSVKVIREFDRKKLEGIARQHIGRLEAERRVIVTENARVTSDLVKKIEKEANAKMVTTFSGLQYVDLKVGTGRRPKREDTVTVHYTGWLADGTVFQDSRDDPEPRTFPVTRAVSGWIEALQTMNIGGRRKLIVPSHLGYGPIGRPGLIPPNAVLVYELELLKVEGPEKETP